MAESRLRYYDFQFDLALTPGTWRWTTRVDNNYSAGSSQIRDVVSPYGLLRDSIPIPGEVILAMAESIRTAGGQGETGQSDHVVIVPAFEALPAGCMVNIWDIGGPKARKAVATSLDKLTHGFVLTAVWLGGDAIVHFEGLNTQLSGLITGNTIYLSPTVPGVVTNTAPSEVGQVVQPLGIATSATTLSFELDTPTIIR